MGEDEKKTFWMIKRKKNPPESFFQKLDEDRKKVKQRKVSKIFFVTREIFQFLLKAN